MRRLLSLSILVSLGLSLLGASLLAAPPAVARPCDAVRLYDDTAASKILATRRPFVPTNRDLFYSFDRADWADVAPLHYAEGPGLTDDETRDQLRAFLQRRFPCSPQRVREGLDVFSHPTARQKIPDPTLRAALAALTGTIGEPAIGYLLTQAPVTTIHFGIVAQYGEGLPNGPRATVYPSRDGTFEMVFDGRLRFDPFGSFSALLFHEALHVEFPPAMPAAGDQPDDVGLPEEATAAALESLVYMQMILTDPTIARVPDLLTRVGSNPLAIVRLNSGIAGTDRLNVFVPDGVANLDPVAVGPVTEFYEFYPSLMFDGPGDPAWRALETHGNPLLAAVLPALAESGQSPPDRPDFDRATLEFIDQNQAVLSPGQLLAAACILELDVPCA
jgi:hypothetical protein